MNTLTGIIENSEPGLLFIQLVRNHLSQFSKKKFYHYFTTIKAPPGGKVIDPQFILEQARWITFNPTRRISADWYCQ